MKKFILLSLIALIGVVTLSSNAFAATYSEIYDFGNDEENREASFLFKRNGVLFSINSAQDSAVDDPEGGEAPVQVLRASADLSTWTDVSEEAMFAPLTDHVFKITAIHTFRRHIYLAVETIDGEPELWRIRKTGSKRIFQQVGDGVFAENITALGPMVRRRTIKQQKFFRKNNDHGSNTLFIAAHTPDGNLLYRTKNGKNWELVEMVEDIFTDDAESKIVSFVPMRWDGRYIYAVKDNGQIIRALINDMTAWELVSSIEPATEDFDSLNPTITVTDAIKHQGKLYIVGNIDAEEDIIALYVAENWRDANLADTQFTNGGHAELRKIKWPGALFVLSDGEEGRAQLSVVDKNDEFEKIASSDDTALDHSDGAWFPSLIRYKGNRYFSYHTETGSLIYQF